MIDNPLYVTVKFGEAVPGDAQGVALLAFEKHLRELCPGKWIEVFKDHMGDDSKLRAAMTPEQRAKL